MEKIEKHEEYQYLDLIDNILKNGSIVKGRNGTTKSIFGASMRFSLEDNTIPILTTKKVAWKTCFKELMWFVNGHTDNTLLQNQKVKIWNANASRDFLDSRGLHNLKENDLGPVYGHQWRHFNAKYGSCDDDYSNKGVDQLQYIIDSLKDPNERFSRRLVMSAWNPCQLNEMALPPCHVLTQFNVSNNNELSCSLYQRSGDVGLGVPFNIASYSFLTHIIAKHCDLKPKDFVYFLGNSHIYDDHYTALSEQIKREPREFPKIYIKNKHDNINNYSLDDIDIEKYNPCGKIKMNMRA
jgi:thymidylate synthase